MAAYGVPTGRMVGLGLLGVASGGFFDGILLHQILQWHHLLSRLEGLDIRMQVAADGYFHALMYVLAAVGLWMIWVPPPRAGSSFHALPGRALAVGLLAGFGLWHVLDAILSHWLLGIHRIRMDRDDPITWDLAWVTVFGLVPLSLAWILWRQGSGPGGQTRPAVPLVGVTVLALGLAAQAGRPASPDELTAILFRPGLEPQRVLAAVSNVADQLVWADATGKLVIIRPKPNAQVWRLLGREALLITGSGLPPGCFNYASGKDADRTTTKSTRAELKAPWIAQRPDAG